MDSVDGPGIRVESGSGSFFFALDFLGFGLISVPSGASLGFLILLGFTGASTATLGPDDIGIVVVDAVAVADTIGGTGGPEYTTIASSSNGDSGDFGGGLDKSAEELISATN